MFPWLIWLCMAGTAKGTVPSPLPSGDYIRLTGTSHFHRYYGAIRLPTTLLRPSFRCVHIPRFTRFRGRCRLSPVELPTLYNVNRSQTPLRWLHSCYIDCPHVAFHALNRVGSQIACFGALYCPHCLTSHALPGPFPLQAQGSLLMA